MKFLARKFIVWADRPAVGIRSRMRDFMRGVVSIVLFGSLAPPCFASSTLDPSESKKILQDFIQIYNSSTTPQELRQKLGSLKNVNAEQVAYLFGSDYSRPLPKLGYDLSKLQLSFGRTRIEFQDMANGEAVIDGMRFQFDRNVSLTQNLANFLNLKKPAEAASIFPILFWDQAFAGTDSETGKKGAWSIQDSGIERLVQHRGKDFAAAAGAAGVMSGAAPLMAIIPLHYAIVKTHSMLAPSCEKQAVEIAETLNKNRISIKGVNCAGYASVSENSSIAFWENDRRSRVVYADWDRQQAAVKPHQLLKFDRTSLQEVREDRVTYRAGSAEFEKAKNDIEPYRKVLEIFGKYESCHKCESYFKQELAQELSPKPYNVSALKTKAGMSESQASSRKSKAQ